MFYLPNKMTQNLLFGYVLCRVDILQIQIKVKVRNYGVIE